MATETTPATTTPARKRTTPARKPAAAKPAAAKAEAASAAEPLKIELVHVNDTAKYSKFEPDPALRGTVVGSIYAPLGTSRVIIAVVPGEETPTA